LNQSFNKFPVYGVLTAGLIALSISAILIRFAGDTSPFVLVTYRTVFAVLLLLPYRIIKRKPARREIPTRERLYVALAGICLGLHLICWFTSLYYTSVAAASVLVTIHPVLIILVERLWFKRRFAWTSWLGVGTAFLGSALLGITDSEVQHAFPNATLGNLLAIAAAVFFAAYLLLGREVRQKREWFDYIFPMYSYAILPCILLLIALGENPFNISTVGILVALGLAVGPSIVGHGSMNYAVKFVAPTLLSTLILIEPVLASIMAYYLFDELPLPFSIGAMAIVLVGVGFTWKRRVPGAG
jgi:drug/metabolite transporter (DMT)-like permease